MEIILKLKGDNTLKGINKLKEKLKEHGVSINRELTEMSIQIKGELNVKELLETVESYGVLTIKESGFNSMFRENFSKGVRHG